MESPLPRTLLQIGAGGIGRGFLAQLFSLAGWEVVFVEVSPPLLEGLQRRPSYTIWEVDSHGESPCPISGYRAVDGRDVNQVVEEVRRCDIAATAVGLNGLSKLAPTLSRGLALRDAPLDILVCENGATAAEDLRQSILASAPGPLPDFGCVRTSIGRMTPAPVPGMEPLDVRVEPYRSLPVEKSAFTGPVPDIPHLLPKEDFTLVLRQKLYLHNLTHAVLAYGGSRLGLPDVPSALAVPRLRSLMHQAGEEASRALSLAHGSGGQERGTIHRDCLAILADLERRYGNTALADPLARVARDPLRKLAGDDRLVGAARLCLDHQVTPHAITETIHQACLYEPQPDDPSLPLWGELQAKGWEAILAHTAGLSPSEPLYHLLEQASSHRAF